MHDRSGRWAYACGLPAAAMLLMGGCQEATDPSVTEIEAEAGRERPPSIDTPDVRLKIPARPRPELLPEKGAAHWPAFDGDRFFVTFPATEDAELKVEEVERVWLEGALAAVGFEPGLRGLTSPEKGTPLDPADLSTVVADLSFEYRAWPKTAKQLTREMVTAFEREEATSRVDETLRLVRGMTFSQYLADIEREQIQFPFRQIHDGVPIEHALVLATAWAGQGITSVRGVLFSNYTVGNKVVISEAEAPSKARDALARVKGVDRVPGQERVETTLILLPYGNDRSGGIELRYTYRMTLQAYSTGELGPFILWLDAESGEILKLIPLFGDVGGTGEVYNRDPGIGTTPLSLQVDPAAGMQYVLRLGGVINRVDLNDDGFNAADVSISSMGGGSSATFANFNQAPINVEAQALCGGGTNKGFQQVNFFGVIYRYYQSALAHGVFTPFPTSAWNPRVEITNYCNANASMAYGACEGYYNAACPSYATGDDAGENFMNFAHDNSVVGHELAHNAVPRLTSARPNDWCGMLPCPIPLGWSAFHDLADAWADHYENSNCIAGWVGKNMFGVDASLNCLQHDEDGYLPRLHDVGVPFNPATPADHFPEHRDAATGGYADGQMAAAALWQVRLGMRSKCRPSGQPQFWVRVTRALKNTGFLGFSPGSSDRGMFQYLYDLEVELMDEWATSGAPGGPPAFAHNGAHTANKVAAGFAKTGLFLVPWSCLDGDAGTSDPTSCPAGDTGADAVIDIDDNDLGDDITVSGVNHYEHDFLELDGAAPTFQVWTGPRWKLNASGQARPVTGTALCNTEYEVDVSIDPTFATAVSSGWTAVDTDPTNSDVDCYGTFTPDAAEWMALQSDGALSRIYYRVRTRSGAGVNERISTEPGNGLWTVPPPYAVITTSGESDY